MQSELFETCRKKYATRQFALLSLGIALLFSAVLVPIQLWLNSDILLRETPFPMFADFLMDIVNCLYFWVTAVFWIYFLLAFGPRKSGPVYAISVCSVLALYLIDAAAYALVINGALPHPGVFFAEILPGILPEIGIAFLEIAAIAGTVLWNRRQILATKEKNETDGGFCFRLPQRLFDRRNPLCVLIAESAAVHSLMRLIQRLIRDIRKGAPADGVDLAWMIFYYLCDIALVAIGYLVILLLINRLHAKDAVARREFDAGS